MSIFKRLIFLLFLLSSELNATELSLSQYFKKASFDGFDETGLWILGVGSVATLVAFNYDQQMKERWKNHQQMSSSVSQYGDFWGTGIPQTLIFAGQTYWDKENGIPAFEGLILGGVVTHAAKIAIGRKRPDSQTRTAMPSGHTQAAFSIASSMTESYGWRVGLPFWGMGVLTGLSRLADNAHWLSDVVAGATLGTFFGRSAYQHHQYLQPTFHFDRGKMSRFGLALQIEW